MCSGSEAGSYVRLTDCVYHSTLGLRVIKKRRRSSRFRGGIVPGFSADRRSPRTESARSSTLHGGCG